MPPKVSKVEVELKKLTKLDGNKTCADCPEKASSNICCSCVCVCAEFVDDNDVDDDDVDSCYYTVDDDDVISSSIFACYADALVR